MPHCCSYHHQGNATFDFSGTGTEVYGNCNAPRAITLSALIYCLRCMVGQDIPLNQVRRTLPPTMRRGALPWTVRSSPELWDPQLGHLWAVGLSIGWVFWLWDLQDPLTVGPCQLWDPHQGCGSPN